MRPPTMINNVTNSTARSRLALWLAIGLLLTLALTACGGSPAGPLVKEGNDAYTRAAYDEAWAAYQAAQIEDPERAEPYYNAANALYRQGQYAEALEQMQLALAYADQETLAASGFFNRGNSAFNSEDPAAAVESYRQALLRNPDDLDAKYNLELALQQLEQQEQENQEQPNEEEQQDEGDQQNEEQQDESESGEGEEEQEQEGEQSESQDGEGDQEQEQAGEEGDPSDQQDGQDGQPEDEGEPQDEDESQPGQDGQPDQPKPGDGELTEGEPGSDDGFGVMPEPGQRLSADQARQLLAAIGQNSQTLAQRLGQIFAGGNRPPVQDW